MKLSLPDVLPIELTSKCNLRCNFCLRTKEHLDSASNDIDDEIFTKQLLPLAKRIGSVLFIGYGEPFLNSNILKYLKMLSDAKIEVSIATNGLILSQTTIRTLVNLKYFKIHFSIDSPDESLYQQLRGAELNDVFKNINRLVEAGFKSKNIIVCSIILKESIASLQAFPKILRDLKIGTYMIQPYHEVNLRHTSDNLYLTNDLEYHIDKIQTACNKYDIRLIKSNLPRLKAEIRGVDELKSKFAPCKAKQTKMCKHPWNITHIDKEGLVYPCCYYAKSKHVLGDLKKQSFAEVWQGPDYNNFRNMLLGKSNHELLEECKRCDHVENTDYHPYRNPVTFIKDQLKKMKLYKTVRKIKNSEVVQTSRHEIKALLSK